jgi:hypothetical protein
MEKMADSILVHWANASFHRIAATEAYAPANTATVHTASLMCPGTGTGTRDWYRAR